MAIGSTFSTSDINTELGKSSGASLSTNDADFAALAGKSSAGVAISTADLVGRQMVQAVVTIASVSGRYGFSGGIGACSISTYRGDTLEHILDVSGNTSAMTVQVTNDSPPSGYLTHVHLPENNAILTYGSRFLGNLSLSGGTVPWDGSDVGQNKTVNLFGDT